MIAIDVHKFLSITIHPPHLLHADARVAALCLRHGVRELWTADRDFCLFPALRVRNPLVG